MLDITTRKQLETVHHVYNINIRTCIYIFLILKYINHKGHVFFLQENIRVKLTGIITVGVCVIVPTYFKTTFLWQRDYPGILCLFSPILVYKVLVTCITIDERCTKKNKKKKKATTKPRGQNKK